MTDDREQSTLEWVRARRQQREEERERRESQRAGARYSRSGDDRDKANVSAGYRARMAEERERREREHAKKRRPAGHARRVARRSVRQVTAPARAQVTSGMRVIGLTLAVTALYLVLTTEEQRPVLSPALNGLGNAFAWLAAPDRSIPYAR
jgi:biopolymer transport protein ExbB/TolQ